MIFKGENLKVIVEVKEDKILKFFDLLNVLKDEMIIDFKSLIEEEIIDTEFEEEKNENISNNNKNKS